MLTRITVTALNAYREAVRARVLYGLFGLAVATRIYSLFVARLSLHQEPRVVADLGATFTSLYAVLVAIVLGSTTLYRELELKTVFPILSRPIRRHEYLFGKFFGSVLTLLVFILVDTGTVLLLLGAETAPSLGPVVFSFVATLVALGILLSVSGLHRVYALIPWSLAYFLVGFYCARTAGAERGYVITSLVLSLCEVSIVSGVALFFSSFSSPFLTAVFTLGLFVMGRSSDTLAHLPEKLLGHAVVSSGRALVRVIPNLQLYVPARALLLGQDPNVTPWAYVGRASLHAVAYASVLLCLSALIFRKRDFQ